MEKLGEEGIEEQFVAPALLHIEKAIRIRKQLGEQNTRWLAVSYGVRGSFLQRMDKAKEAEADHKRALHILQAFEGDRAKSSLAAVYNNLGLVYRKTGQFQRAENSFFRAVEYNKVLVARAPLVRDHRLRLFKKHVPRLAVRHHGAS